MKRDEELLTGQIYSVDILRGREDSKRKQERSDKRKLFITAVL